MPAVSEQPAAAITGYRWFRVGPDGSLRGARNVVWPADRDLHAEHVSMPLLAERRPARSALSRTGWTALRCAVLTAAAGMSLLMVAVAAWLLLVLVLTLNLSPFPLDRDAQPMSIARGLAIVGTAALYGAMATTFGGPVLAALAPRRPGHTCPGNPKRIAGRLRPGCGIYAYRTPRSAHAAATRERYGADPLGRARVSLWGRVFEHTVGFRAESARIDALLDSGEGIVEIPAARYGVPTVPLSALIVPELLAGLGRCRPTQ